MQNAAAWVNCYNESLSRITITNSNCLYCHGKKIISENEMYLVTQKDII